MNFLVKKNKIFHVFLSGSIMWRIKKKDPVTYSMGTPKGCFVINPLNISSLGENGFDAIPLSKTEVLLKIDRLSLLVPINIDLSKHVSTLEMYLKYLRIISQQVGIPMGIVMMHEDNKAKIVRNNITFKPREIAFRKYYLDTAVNSKLMKNTFGRADKDKFPVYHEIMVESISAYMKDDFRKTILYSAIAVEIAANTILEEEYKKALIINKSKFLRLITIRQPKNMVVIKDPIYECLSYRKEDFKRTFHERPLYLLRKSLLVDDESLYNRCIKLHQMRNSIVHKSENLDNTIDKLNQENAAAAIKCATEVFKWLIIKEKYSLPFNEGFLFHRIPASKI
jgi:hypothetical protein